MKTTLLLATALLALAPARAANITPIEVRQTTIPSFPWNLTFRGITEGKARIVLAVDENGKLIDALPVAYTKRAFGDEALRAVQEWEYKPLTVDGKPHAAVTQLDFNFESQGVVVNRTISEMVEVFLGHNRVDWQRVPCPLRDLDAIPKPVKVVMPQYLAAPQASGTLGEVVVQFYIDTEGKVRLPHLVEFTDDAMGTQALAAVRQWEFAPPTKNGTAVLVRASQRFTFVAK